jgi:hypothetical protein
MTEAERKEILDAMVKEAFEELTDRTDDIDDRNSLWQSFATGIFAMSLEHTPDGDRIDIAKQLNDALDTAGVPWRLVQGMMAS